MPPVAGQLMLLTPSAGLRYSRAVAVHWPRRLLLLVLLRRSRFATASTLNRVEFSSVIQQIPVRELRLL